MRNPIIIFAYARPLHLQKTIEALLQNHDAEEHDLIVYSDAAKLPKDETAVKEIRDYLKRLSGFKSVHVHERINNYGLAKSIISGVTETLQQYERVIVLEDDMLTSPHFLNYMNEALDRFEDDDRVASIHGYIYPVQGELPEAFFLRGADCWGWGTWRRAWEDFNPDGIHLLKELERKKLISEFNFNDTYPYSKMLQKQIAGENDSWAIRWYASTFLKNKLTLYPGRSLVHNIGNDGSGTHCESSSQHDSTLSQTPILLNDIHIEACEEAKRAFAQYFKSINGGLWRRIKQVLKGTPS